ncbi:MAG: hypothetical protein IPM34_05830 [Saprospiraceae bacterium]|nr:hypothetical protein [Saprospiraceae bacterium]
MKFFYIALLIGLFANPGLTTADSTNYEIVLTAAYFKDMGVVLRWVPTTPGSWKLCNYYGVKIERALVNDANPESLIWETLQEKYKPAELERWKESVQMHPEDTFLMIAGQAIHGKTTPKEISLQVIQEKSDELQNLYSACLLSAEFSRQAGLHAALRFEDKNVQSDKKYLYRIIPLMENAHSAIVQVHAIPYELPQVEVDTIFEGEKMIEIFWNKKIYKSYYSAFNIYKRTESSQKWIKQNAVPVAFTAYKDKDQYIYRDSVAQNYKKQYYKIEGLTSFATTGPWSDEIAAMGRDRTPPEAPYNIKLEYLGNALMKISWECKAEDISGFRISKSNEKQKEFVELTESPLGKNIRTYIDSTCNEMINNYYWIGVFDHENNVNVSLPKYGSIIDSLPPAPPTGLEGSIDTNGIVTLSWRLGPENDIKGYYVHSSHHKKHTFTSRTDQPVQDTVWRDSLPLNVLTEEIHYKVVAIDHRFNYSDYSKVLTLRKPDKVAPSAPVLISSYSDQKGILLKWNNSQSHDTKMNILLRKRSDQNSFEEIYNCSSAKPTAVFLDSQLVAGMHYEYVLVAVDDAGLRSEMASHIERRAYETKVVKPVTKIIVETDTLQKMVNLYWKYPNSRSQKFVIYRALNNQAFTSYKVIEGRESFTDRNLKRSDRVRYRIKVVNEKSWQSEFSEEVSVSF